MEAEVAKSLQKDAEVAKSLQKNAEVAKGTAGKMTTAAKASWRWQSRFQPPVSLPIRTPVHARARCVLIREEYVEELKARKKLRGARKADEAA